jgi:hypothetical protein
MDRLHESTLDVRISICNLRLIWSMRDWCIAPICVLGAICPFGYLFIALFASPPPRCSRGGAKDARKLLSLGEQWFEGDTGGDLGFAKPIEPEHHFVGFFRHDSHLGGELRVRAASPGGAIVGCGGCRCVEQLATNPLRHDCPRECLHQLDGAIREVFDALLEVVGLAHARRRSNAPARTAKITKSSNAQMNQ